MKKIFTLSGTAMFANYENLTVRFSYRGKPEPATSVAERIGTLFGKADKGAVRKARKLLRAAGFKSLAAAPRIAA